VGINLVKLLVILYLLHDFEYLSIWWFWLIYDQASYFT
jgi:hypothetical protein